VWLDVKQLALTEHEMFGDSKISYSALLVWNTKDEKPCDQELASSRYSFEKIYSPTANNENK